MRPVCPDSLRWECLIKPRSKLSSPSLVFDNDVQAEIGHPRGMLNQINFWNLKVPFSEWLSTHGSTPLPPYIKRKSEVADSANYQTIYAKIPGSVAAPTAGLHFTDSLLRTLENKSVQIAELTLHVGYGTFAPIRSNPVEEHFMYNEAYQIPPHTMELLLKAKANKLRIIAVGTSTVRALESISLVGYGGETSLFVYPGYRFRWVDGLITNFHLPRSSLFVLVSAFLGLELTRTCYQQAISRNYRFYSYGDAMFIR